MQKQLELRNLIFSKMMNEGVKRAVRERLKLILSEEEKQFIWWLDTVKEKLNFSRQRAIERRFNKRCQALKIVIYMLTPYMERTDDVPAIVVKKPKKPES